MPVGFTRTRWVDIMTIMSEAERLPMGTGSRTLPGREGGPPSNDPYVKPWARRKRLLFLLAAAVASWAVVIGAVYFLAHL